MDKLQEEWESLQKRFPGMKMPDLNAYINSRYKKAGGMYHGMDVTPANLSLLQRYTGEPLPPNMAPEPAEEQQ